MSDYTSASSRTPERQSPFFSLVTFPKKTATTQVLTTGGGAVTMTVAQATQGIIPCDCQDAQTFTFPTAALLVAGIPDVTVGLSFDLDVINYGDTTLTMALGAGITQTTITSKVGVLTIVAQASKRFTFVCTGVQDNGDAADAWVVWPHGSIAAANV